MGADGPEDRFSLPDPEAPRLAAPSGWHQIDVL